MTAVLDSPAAVLVGHFPPLSEAWHAARADGIGGSEIAAVLGLSRWESRFSLYHRKAGRLPAQTENDEMEAGKRLEDAICQKFADSHPELVILRSGTYRSAARPWQIANPDRLVVCPEDNALLDAKFALYGDEWGDPGSEDVPPYYLSQARWYMDVLGFDTCYIQVFIGGSADWREYAIHPNDADTELMRAKGAEFMADLAAGRRPDIDDHSATYQAVKDLNPVIDDVKVDLPTDIALGYLHALQDEKAAKAAKTLACSLVADHLGNARRGMYDGKCICLRVPGKGDAAPHLRPANGLDVDDYPTRSNP